MKTSKLLIAAGLLGLSYSANAAIITINDGSIYDGSAVGNVDTLLAQADKNNLPKDQSGNPISEENWVNSILDPNGSASYTVKFDPVSYYGTDAANTYAVSFLDTDPRPDYFLVKNSTFQALYSNEAYVGWGVFDTSDLDPGFNLTNEGFTISHVTLFEGDGSKGLCNPNLDPTCAPPAVPIPPAVWLFGSGLLGLVGVARRKDPV